MFLTFQSELDLREPIVEDDMKGLLKVLGSKIPNFKELLVTPRAVVVQVESIRYHNVLI
jgi:hypothetical protein